MTPHAYTVAELMELKPRPKTRWGNWHLARHGKALDYRRPGGRTMYSINLDEMTSPAACLDWIFQAAFKTWMTDQDRSALLEAIRDTIRPQATLCSWGIARARGKA